MTFDAKETYKEGFIRHKPVSQTIDDLLLAAYLLSSSDKSYSLEEMCEAYIPGGPFWRRRICRVKPNAGTEKGGRTGPA